MIIDFARVFDQVVQLRAKLCPIITTDDLEQTREMETKYALDKYPIYYYQEKDISKQLPQELVLRLTEKLPAIFIIDKNGIIREKFYKERAKQLPRVEDIIKIIRKLVE